MEELDPKNPDIHPDPIIPKTWNETFSIEDSFSTATSPGVTSLAVGNDGRLVANSPSTPPAQIVLPRESVEGAEWVFSGTFSVTDADTVAWGAGTLTTEDGNAYSIGAGNTGNMAAKTYIYFDVAVSTTAFQTTTTAATSVGAGKILVAIAQNATGEAKFMALNDNQYNIDAANVVANSITANELSTSITYAGSIVIDTSGLIRSGQTAYNTGTGWWIGNDGGTPKLSIGNPSANYLTWDGTGLTINGYAQNNIGSFGGNGSDGSLSTAGNYSVDFERSSSHYLTIADASQTGLDITGDLTIEAWIKIETAPSLNQTFVIAAKDDFANTTTRQYYFVYEDSGGTKRFVFMASGGTARFSVLNHTLSTATLIHVAAAFDIDGDTTTFYVNGVSVGSAALSGAVAAIQNTATAFSIGARFNGGTPSDHFDGIVDDVRIWNTTRSATEIADNMNYELLGTESGLVGYWKLNNSLLDETSNNNDLSNPNSAPFSTDAGAYHTINVAGAASIVKNYTEINITSGKTVAFFNPHASGTIIILKSKGDVTIAGTINASGMGGAGGTGGDGATDTGGTAGTTGRSLWLTSQNADGGNFGASGGVGGGATTAMTSAEKEPYLFGSGNEWRQNNRTIFIACGSGGGGGGFGDTDDPTSQKDGGTGGRGGGAILIECAGSLNFTGTVDVSGKNGTDGEDVVNATISAAAGGGGGGGGAGMCLILYNELTASSGTISAAGGNGGAGGDADGGGAGTSLGGGGGSGATAYGGGGAAGGAGGDDANGSAGSAAGASSGAGGGGGGGAGSDTAARTGGAGGAGGTSMGGLTTQNTASA